MSLKKTSPHKTPHKTPNEEHRFRAYFVRLFEKYNIRNEEQFTTLGKWLIFSILVIVEILILLQHFDHFSERGGWVTLISILAVEFVLTLSETLKLFIVKKGKIRPLFYALDVLAACLFMFLTSGAYPVILYMLVLTELYIGTKKTKPAVALLITAILFYAASYFVQTYVQFHETFYLYQFLTSLLSSVLALFLHFTIMQIALAFYWQFLRLDKTLKELDESKKELEKAYAVVAEVTALEERQRIAKEIHDTAGHSLTTVIMQTEAAKLIMDKNPEDAKNKIIAANLQAKNALEELRDSVHLLSGQKENQTLKTTLENIIHESMDGTGITVRSEIEDVAVFSAKARFLCNTLKEGISNGLRHGGATAFWFELKQDGDKIRFLLSDNGKGVPLSALKIGFGLSSMKDRAKMFGGEVRFQSEEDEGFELVMILPMDKSKGE